MVMVTVLFTSCKKEDDTVPANQVFMESLKFSPSTITVSVGTTVTWTNKESVVHTVTSDGSAFESGDMNNSDTFSFTFTTAGTFPYHCIYHAGMTGTVIVE
jgi:plastocyanin